MPSPNNLQKVYFKDVYPPPCERDIWYNKCANADMISKAIEGFDWDKAFLDKSADEKITREIYPKYHPNQTCDYLITPKQQTLCIETNIFNQRAITKQQAGNYKTAGNYKITLLTVQC